MISVQKPKFGIFSFVDFLFTKNNTYVEIWFIFLKQKNILGKWRIICRNNVFQVNLGN